MTLLDKAQISIIGVFNSLPLVLMTALLVLGLGLGNFGMLSIAIGQIAMFPIIGLIHFVLKLIKIGDIGDINYSDTVVLVPSNQYSKVNILPSMWITQITYFFSYVFFNAYDVYNDEPISSDPDYSVKVNNRKTRTAMIMTWAVILGLLLIAGRWIGKSEYTDILPVRIFSVVFSIGLGSCVAFIANTISKQPNVGTQKMDIFGISQQMMLIPKTSEVTVCQTAGSNQ